MTKATPKPKTKPITEHILGGPVQRPYPGVRSIPAKTMQRAVKDLFRERVAEERPATAKG